MGKIPKNLSDSAMFKDYKENKKEKSLFDIAKEFDDADTVKSHAAKKDDSYMDKYLTDALNKELLKLKLDLYKDGIIDYQIKIGREGNKIVLYPSVKKNNRI